ncbi:MAG TPA: Hsp20/alpha crystallin family protein [Bacteroidota bacterium]|nr:Hsp20/alpha crystallin family protein [Bacteroidota bacterium]
MSETRNALIKHNGQPAVPPVEGPVSAPAADVLEEHDGYVLMLDMPGVLREEISVAVAEGTLAVKAPLARPRGGEGRIIHREIIRGGYERYFSLGEGIDREGIDARYENGVLTVRLRKSEAVKPKQITIR